MSQRNSSVKAVDGKDRCVVFVVDDDDSTRRALARLFYSVQLRAEVFASAQEFRTASALTYPAV